MKKLFTLIRSLHTLFGNIEKRLESPILQKHALDSEHTDIEPPYKTKQPVNAVG